MAPTQLFRTPEIVEGRFVARLRACGVRDKLNYSLGEVSTITGFGKNTVLKLKHAGTLKPWRPAGYGRDCYPRDQVKTLLD